MKNGARNRCIKLLHAMMKTYSFALACCFWILFDLDWSWWHCSCWCCSCSCCCFSFCCRCWFSCCSCPGSWSSSRLRCSCWSLSCRGCWSGSLSSSLSSSRSGSKTCCQYRLRRRNNHINFILERQTSEHCKQRKQIGVGLWGFDWFGPISGSTQNWVWPEIGFDPKSGRVENWVWPDYFGGWLLENQYF